MDTEYPDGVEQSENKEPSSPVSSIGWKSLPTIAVELVVYGAIVVAYFFAVLSFLSDLLAGLFGTDLLVYSAIALLLIVVQGVALEFLTTLLLRGVSILRGR